MSDDETMPTFDAVKRECLALINQIEADNARMRYRLYRREINNRSYRRKIAKRKSEQ